MSGTILSNYTHIMLPFITSGIQHISYTHNHPHYNDKCTDFLFIRFPDDNIKTAACQSCQHNSPDPHMMLIQTGRAAAHIAQADCQYYEYP